MIEGGGFGVYEPKEIGPTSVQSANGVIDILVEDEAEWGWLSTSVLSGASR